MIDFEDVVGVGVVGVTEVIVVRCCWVILGFWAVNGLGVVVAVW